MRIRALKPGFFRNEHLCELSPLHRLAFAGLWCCADRSGRIEDRPKRLKAEIFPYDDTDLDSLMWDLAEVGFIVRYAVEGHPYVEIPNWDKHQHPRQDEQESQIPAYEPGMERAPRSVAPVTRDTDEPPLDNSVRSVGVYFIRSGSHVKIGFSADCDARVARLLRTAPKAKCLAVWKADSVKEAQRRESELHNKFSGSRANHEWFVLTADIKEFIETVTRKSLSSDAAESPQRMGNGRWEVGNGISQTEGASAPPLADADARAAKFIDRFSELYRQERGGAHYMGRPAVDWPRAQEIVRSWTDDDWLDKLVIVFLNSDDKFIAQSTRSIPVFHSRASWCDDRLREGLRREGRKVS